MGHQATGTVRKGCIDKALLESDVALKKKERGTFNIKLIEKAILSADGMITVLSLLPHLVLVLIPCVLSITIPRN
jgi:adenosylcobinamide amidohydrolase